jgi:hypothetical protein
LSGEHYKGVHDQINRKDQDGLAQHFYGTCDLYNREQLRLHHGTTMQIEHLGCQWIQFHLVWAKTFEELCRIHHSSALALMPTQGNYAKGNLPVGELRQRFDISGKFVEWYAERHFSPAIRNIEQIVVNTNVSYFEAFARNGGSDRVYLEGAVRAFNLQSKTVKYLYNTITNSIEHRARCKHSSRQCNDYAQR